MSIFFLVFYLQIFLSLSSAQAVSANTPVPPLQWLNLTGLLQGSSQPPPLKNAIIGYDESRSDLAPIKSPPIVSHLTQPLQALCYHLWRRGRQWSCPVSNIPVRRRKKKNSYTIPPYPCPSLNLDTLTWSIPSPPPSLQRTPSARSSAIGGEDFAASKFVIRIASSPQQCVHVPYK